MSKNLNIVFKRYYFLIILMVLFTVACSSEAEVLKTELTLSVTKLSFDEKGQAQSIQIKSNYDWSIVSSEDWCTTSLANGKLGTTEVSVIAESNPVKEDRNCIITITSNNEQKEVVINQQKAGIGIPEDINGVESKAMELAAKMIVGWNIGNSLDVPEGETKWGNPAISKQLIDSVKAAGFNAVRIPCAWNKFIEDENTHKIMDSRLARVKEVVDYCVENDMYAIINTHWDGGWLEEHPVYSQQKAINEKLYAIWTQLALTFRDYDEHLLFAGTNEVRENWEPKAENIEVQESFCQTFVDAVRETGGKNAFRNLIVQTYNTNIDFGIQYHNMPVDIVSDRLIVEVHYYDPWDFCGQEEGDVKTQWGKGAGYTDISVWAQEDHLKRQFSRLKTKYISKNIPVIIGEYGALYRADLTGETLRLHNESRNYFLKTITRTAKEYGIVSFVWDNGWIGNNGFGLFNRETGQAVFSDAIDAIVEGATIK